MIAIKRTFNCNDSAYKNQKRANRDKDYKSTYVPKSKKIKKNAKI